MINGPKSMSLEEYITYKETERFLESLVCAKPTPHFVAPKHKIIRKNPFGLERVRSFLTELGNPQLKNKYIHITGTSGKTSTTYFTANIFHTQGYNTGMFISPPICPTCGLPFPMEMGEDHLCGQCLGGNGISARPGPWGSMRDRYERQSIT